jgi:hypothetical protein
MAGGWPAPRAGGPEPRPGIPVGCSGTSVPVLFGLLARPITLDEMVNHLERGCLVLDEVRFRPGNYAILEISPDWFAQLARALGLAQGAYRVAVPAESTPGWPPDTAQALRRGVALREELIRNGASMQRLLEEPGFPVVPFAVGRGLARAMLLRVDDRCETRSGLGGHAPALSRAC